jgi:hypothetical protein
MQECPVARLARYCGPSPDFFMNQMMKKMAIRITKAMTKADS